MAALKALKERRTAIAEEMHRIHDTAEEEDRGFTTEESSKWDELRGTLDGLDRRIARGNALEDEARDKAARETDEELERRSLHRESQRSYSPEADDPNRPLNSGERARAMRAWMLGEAGNDGDNPISEADFKLAQRCGLKTRKIIMGYERGRDIGGEDFQAPRNRDQVHEQSKRRVELEKETREYYEKAYDRIMRAAGGDGASTAEVGQRARVEMRDQSVGTNNQGGFTVPNAMMRTLEEALLQWAAMRGVSEIMTTATGADLPMPTLNDTAAKGSIVTEGTTAGNAQLTFAQIVMGAFMYESGVVNVSYELMQDSATNLAANMGRWLGQRIGRAQNEHFTTGDAASKPSGILQTAVDSTVIAATAGKVAWDELMTLKHSVDPAYRGIGASWMMADATLLKVKLIQDANNRPLWLPNLVPGEPDLFDGDPIVVNQDMPTAAAAKGIVYGALSKYLIREVRGFELRRLDELFALDRQVGFYGYSRADGVLLDAGTNPVKYMTLA